MRFLGTVFAFFLIQTVTAQDYCKMVRREVSDNKMLTELSSPYNHKEIPPLRVRRNISTEEDATFDNFIMIFYAECSINDIYIDGEGGSRTEKEEKALTVIFEDNSKIVDDTVDVMHDISEDRTEAMRYIYYPIIPETANDFTSKKISKFIIAGQEKVVPPEVANSIMEYSKCIRFAR